MELPCSADGLVFFQRLPRQQSVCERIQGIHVPNGSAVGSCGDLGYGRTEKGGRGHEEGKDRQWEEVESYRDERGWQSQRGTR